MTIYNEVCSKCGKTTANLVADTKNSIYNCARCGTVTVIAR